MSDIVTVTGATGHVGRRVAEHLLAHHRRVRVVARSAERLAELAARGAEPFAGSLDDPELVRRAFDGARAVFSMIPPGLAGEDVRAAQNRASEAIVGGLRAAGVPYVVNLSSIGAEVPYGTGPIAGLHDHEERLDGLDDDVAIVHLRPASFMENLLAAIPMIRDQGAYFGPLPGDLPQPMIATVDVGHEAARLLFELGFEDKTTQELLGPRDYTLAEATSILGRAIGRPDLAYVQVSYEAARGAMLGMGMPAYLVDSYLEMLRAMASGKIHPAEPRLPENTTPTTLADFAPTFAAAYRAAGG
jgi:uncharacterized protein YbjT (DUF2867 family)